MSRYLTRRDLGKGLSFCLLTSAFFTDSTSAQNHKKELCPKLKMQKDGMVRLARIEIVPESREEYLRLAKEVGELSLLTEPGVLTMYAMEDSQDHTITILETYASAEAYQSHLKTSHFQKYKPLTAPMVKSLKLLDQRPINPIFSLKTELD